MASANQDFKTAYMAGKDAYKSLDRKTGLPVNAAIFFSAIVALAIKRHYALPWYFDSVLFLVLMFSTYQLLKLTCFRK